MTRTVSSTETTFSAEITHLVTTISLCFPVHCVVLDRLNAELRILLLADDQVEPYAFRRQL
jgi:hypothetical protein